MQKEKVKDYQPPYQEERDPNEHDVAGAPEHKDTANGREETKKDTKGAANTNG